MQEIFRHQQEIYKTKEAILNLELETTAKERAAADNDRKAGNPEPNILIMNGVRDDARLNM